MASLIWTASDYSYNIPWRKHHWSSSTVSHLAQRQKLPHQSWSAFWSKRLVSKITNITTANPKRHIAKRLSTSKRLSTLRIQSPKRPPKTTTINKRLSYQTAQDDPAYSYEFPRHTLPCYNLPYLLIHQQIFPQNGLRKNNNKQTTTQQQMTLITSALPSHIPCQAVSAEHSLIQNN